MMLQLSNENNTNLVFAGPSNDGYILNVMFLWQINFSLYLSHPSVGKAVTLYCSCDYENTPHT